MSDIEFEKSLAVRETPIKGLLVVEVPVHGDSRGWFKENWQREKMCALGAPDLRWVQNNISYNAKRGVTRGIHAEPWDKWISVAAGRIFGAWVDLREGSDTYGKTFTCELDPSRAILTPRGVGNSFQALEDGTVYTYLVNAHWSAELKKTYTFVNLADPALAIEWPIPLSECELSQADRTHPFLKDVVPMGPKRTLVTGSNGQLGRAVRALAESRGVARWFDFTDRSRFDFTDLSDYGKIDWSLYGAVINCAAYTSVDAAESLDGRVACWKANAMGPSLLAKTCAEHGIVLVHVSSDYVFDGECESHDEDEPFGPLGVYGQAKAAGDLAVVGCPSHYIIRSSWVIGDGDNFVRTMATLSNRCVDPSDSLNHVTVVNDQFGRLSFASDMAQGIFWLLGYHEGDIEPTEPCQFGTYNLTSSGSTASWAEIAALVFKKCNDNAEAVLPVSTADYYANKQGPISPRPVNSTLDLTKIENTGFAPRGWETALDDYLTDLIVAAGK